MKAITFTNEEWSELYVAIKVHRRQIKDLLRAGGLTPQEVAYEEKNLSVASDALNKLIDAGEA